MLNLTANAEKFSARLLVCSPDRWPGLEKLKPQLPGVEQFYVTGETSKATGVGAFDELLSPVESGADAGPGRRLRLKACCTGTPRSRRLG